MANGPESCEDVDIDPAFSVMETLLVWDEFIKSDPETNKDPEPESEPPVSKQEPLKLTAWLVAKFTAPPLNKQLPGAELRMTGALMFKLPPEINN